MTDIEFQEFPKLARYSKDIVVTEKIDGTNAQVIITEDGRIGAGSRNRLITPQNDNFGFAGWVDRNKDMLIETLGPGRHFGEWAGNGIQRTYGLKSKVFVLFAAHIWYAPFKRGELPEGLSCVPLLYQGPHDTRKIDDYMDWLAHNGSVFAPGFMNPEGVVVYHTASKTLYKKTFEHDEGKWKANQ